MTEMKVSVNETKQGIRPYLVWVLAAFNILLAMLRFTKSGITGPEAFSNASFVITTAVFSVMGVLIILRAEGNRVGWLMLGLGSVLADPFGTYLVMNNVGPQTPLTPGMYVAVWTQGWLFFLNIYAIFLIILHFPTGRPPTRRWNLVSVISLATLAQFILVYTFQPQLGDNAFWTVENPIARLSSNAEDTLAGLLFGLGMIFLAISSLVSIFVRFRRAGGVERAQIKWLLYSGVLAFAGIWYRLVTYDPGASDWTDYLLVAALLSIVSAISIAIFRYRLYDIDIIIRRTLQYAIVTGILALTYFGGIVILQGILGPLTGSANSPVVTVITTLGIAALFNPLRIRVQDFIDRRFYRKKYDAEQTLAQFAETARDEVDMERLSAALLGVVEETVQPERASLWVKK